MDVLQLGVCNTLPSLESLLLFSVCYGSWFDHVKGWTNGMDTGSNLLQVTYEEMSQVKQALGSSVGRSDTKTRDNGR